jgi:molybdopterin converting factor small subunit
LRQKKRAKPGIATRRRYPKMSIRLYLPGRLSHRAKGKDLFELNGNTVGECPEELIRLIPILKKTLFYDKKLQTTVKVLVNEERADAEGLAKKLEDGDEIRLEIKAY